MIEVGLGRDIFAVAGKNKSKFEQEADNDTIEIINTKSNTLLI